MDPNFWLTDKLYSSPLAEFFHNDKIPEQIDKIEQKSEGEAELHRYLAHPPFKSLEINGILKDDIERRDAINKGHPNCEEESLQFEPIEHPLQESLADMKLEQEEEKSDTTYPPEIKKRK